MTHAHVAVAKNINIVAENNWRKKMVVDEQREIFSKLKDKSDYLKECL